MQDVADAHDHAQQLHQDRGAPRRCSTRALEGVLASVAGQGQLGRTARAPASRACATARWQRSRLPRQSRGVWLRAAVAKWMRSMGSRGADEATLCRAPGGRERSNGDLLQPRRSEPLASAPRGPDRDRGPSGRDGRAALLVRRPRRGALRPRLRGAHRLEVGRGPRRGASAGGSRRAPDRLDRAAEPPTPEPRTVGEAPERVVLVDRDEGAREYAASSVREAFPGSGRGAAQAPEEEFDLCSRATSSTSRCQPRRAPRRLPARRPCCGSSRGPR